MIDQVNRTSAHVWKLPNITASFGTTFTELEWLIIQGKLLGKKLEMTEKELEEWLYSTESKGGEE